MLYTARRSSGTVERDRRFLLLAAAMGAVGIAIGALVIWSVAERLLQP